MVLGVAGSGNFNPGRRREGKVDWRSVNVENKGEKERGKRGEETRRRGEEEENEGRGGVLGDADSGNPGRRPRVPASLYNMFILIR